MLLITCRRKSGLASGEFAVSANMAYDEVKLEQLGARVDPGKIVRSINTESCQQSAAGVVQPDASDYETVGENVELSG